MSALQEWIKGIDLEWIITNLLVILAAAFSLSFHEFCHALTAHWLGDDTAKRMGRLTLNPLKHLSWSGLLMIAIFKFGWAKPVPIDMRRFKNQKVGMAVTALAGPVSNLLLALLSCFALQCFFAFDEKNIAVFFVQGDARYYAFYFLYMMTVLNAGLAAFNLIPISPLDGSKVLAVFLPDNAYAWLMRYERYGMYVLMALLLLDVLDGPLNFLRTGLLQGLSWLTHLPFSAHANIPMILFSN